MRITIKEVAKTAGVSTATVSRVLNKVGRVDEETRRRVQEAAKELNYVPNALGRSLSTRRTEALGMLLPDLYGEFFSDVIRGADETAQHHRYHLLVSSAHNNREKIAATLQMLRGRVDGVVIMSPHIDAQTLNANLPKNLPVVLLNCRIQDGAFNSINIDNFEGARRMVRHLAEHGHRKIAIIKGTEKNLDAEERLAGYLQAIREAGIDSSESIVMDGNFLDSSGYDAAKRILALSPRPTAIFASNDSMAIGALSALREVGVSVPKEMALAGFDDIPIARYLSPALTSVHVPISDLGAMAIQKLLHVMRAKDDIQLEHSLLPTTLAIRESCGCTKEANLINS
jgi:LacI family transcriptional regulator